MSDEYTVLAIEGGSIKSSPGAVTFGEGSTAHVTCAEPLLSGHEVTVEAWVLTDGFRPEGIQSLVSQWTPRQQMDLFAAYDAGTTDGMDTSGFFGAVFDGRHIYFSPQHDLVDRHGKALRFDTHGDFKTPSSWKGHDAGTTDGLQTKGHYGAVFDGRYIYYPPRRDPEGFHSRVLRYDTEGSFDDSAAWSAYEADGERSSQSAVFDGRFIYFCPGQGAVPRDPESSGTAEHSVTGMASDQVLSASGDVMRYDTRAPFKNPGSWAEYDADNTDGLDTRDFDGAVFDGRYIYFAPLSYRAVLRYDTQGDFSSSASWSAFDASDLGMVRCVGAVYDGEYIYFVPYGTSQAAIRVDTREDFRYVRSWSSYRLLDTSGLDVTGFDGAFFDGRYVYYVPYWDEGERYHGVLLRYDTMLRFEDAAAWTCVDAGFVDGLKTVGFNAGATDGRFFYFAAWLDGTGAPERIVGNGRVLRYDYIGDAGSFSLRYSDLGHNGGLCAALPGPRFLINTDQGVFSVSPNYPLKPGSHQLVGVYDGSRVRLYIDGELAAEQPASGKLVSSGEDIAVGRILDGKGRFDGTIEGVAISTVARSSDWVKARYKGLKDS